MASPLFRREALEHAAAGERYEDLFVVVPSRAWTVLVAVVVVLVATLIWSVFGSVPVTVDGAGELLAGSGLATLVAPSDGVIVDERSAGETVASHAAVVRLKVAGSIVVARAAFAGTVIEVPHTLSTFVHRGDVLATIEPPATSLEAIVFVPIGTDRALTEGMAARVSPINANPKVYGVLIGTVRSVAPYPATPQRVASVLQNETLAQTVITRPVREVHIALDHRSDGSFLWSGHSRDEPRVVSGTPTSAGIVVENRRPIAFVFPPLR